VSFSCPARWQDVAQPGILEDWSKVAIGFQRAKGLLMRRMEEQTTSRTYDVWAKVYDNTFGRLLARNQRRAVEQIRQRLRPGDRVLDIGVGTGIMLQYFPRDVFVVGLDLSGGMLDKAATRCREQGLLHCRLVRADAMQPPFADGAFDHVIISHTISVVSDPARLLKLAGRLVKPGGRIVVLNHFLSQKPLIAWAEKKLNPLFVKLGWRSDLSLESILPGTDLHVEYHFKSRMLDVWQIIVLTHQSIAVPRCDDSRAEEPVGTEGLRLET